MKRLALILIALIFLSGISSAQTASDQNKITLQLMSTEPSPMQIGSYADVRFKVTNERSEDYEDVNVSFQENYPFSVDSDNDKSWRIASLESGDSYEFRMQVRVDPNALQGEEELEFKVKRKYSSRTYEIPVQIKADEDGLIVDSVEFPESVGPGTSSEMNITIENRANAYFRNIELGLNPAPETPLVVSGTSTRRIGSISPSESRTFSFTLNTDESAENGVYSIPIQLDYENEAGASLARSASTGIVVGGTPQIEVGLNDEENIYTGETGSVNLRFVNRGEGTAKFVKFNAEETEGFEIRSGSSDYLGDMQADDYQTAELKVYTDPGTDSFTLPIEVTYQENGEDQTETQEVEVDVLTAEERDRYGLSGGSPVIPVVVLLLIVAGGAYYYWRRR